VASSLAPGQQGDHSAFWSKLAGIYGSCYTLKHLQPNTNLKGALTIVCDGKLVVDRLNSQKPIAPTEAHHDVLGAIQNTLRDIPIQISLRYVKGHQDENT